MIHADLQTEPGVTYLGEHAFVRSRFWGIGKTSHLLGWLHSFFKQFYASLTRSDYIALRHGFIMERHLIRKSLSAHCKGNQKFNFHNYMMRALEADSKRIVGIRLACIFLPSICSALTLRHAPHASS
ncbi:hypothetical protein RJ639_037237 [Escallonia herrerae]|uniref:Uncharacterized protein n=1 Tax=Escallonia herrerae TaxID=1293975 RepID=A0AA89BBC9_9ASTE|nr:hypothetical protein RJ639_037237 [Escallonia herrerae]